jgi:hypothetical protein
MSLTERGIEIRIEIGKGTERGRMMISGEGKEAAA